MKTTWERSFWEIERNFHDTELLIVGSGIVGLSAALQYSKKRPLAKILVVDSGILPYGASTRNAGFACIGSVTELLSDFSISGPENVIELIAMRQRGLHALFAQIGKKSCDFKAVGGFELINDEETIQKCDEKIDFLNQKLKTITGLDATYQWEKPSTLKKFGFQGVKKLLHNHAEGHIHTGKLMESLMAAAQKRNIRLLFNLEVKSLIKENNNWLVESNRGFSFNSKKILLCTNGFTRKLLPGLDVNPARAQVFITEEIKNLPFRGTFHLQEGFYYFRDLGQRILLGGGRNLDIQGENTQQFGTTQLIQDELERILQQIILPGQIVKIEQRWSGIMGVGSEKIPIIKMIDRDLACAVRMGGMGVAIGTLAGQNGADLLLEN